jgi:hypothetical protein
MWIARPSRARQILKLLKRLVVEHRVACVYAPPADLLADRAMSVVVGMLGAFVGAVCAGADAGL